MVALTRFASSRGFCLEAALSHDPNLLTLYVPAVDPSLDRIPSLKAALQHSAQSGDKSFFLQLLKIGKDTDILVREISNAISHVDMSSGKYAFLLWNDGVAFGVNRSKNWKQVAGSLIFNHLAKSRINTYRDSLIIVKMAPEPSLIFKEVMIRLAAQHIVYSKEEKRDKSIDLILDLRRGVFHFEGISKVELFADQALSQALYRGQFVEGNSSSGIFGLRSRPDMFQVFEMDKIRALQKEEPHLGFLVRGELDLFPYNRISWGLRAASREIQKRSKIELIEPVGTNRSHIDLPVNQYDTLGNIIHLQVGKPGQSLRFVSAPQELFQNRSSLDVIEPSSGGSLIMPEGMFPIAPVAKDLTRAVPMQARRLKLGVSNTDVVNVKEKGTPAAALYFIGEATDSGFVSLAPANDQPAFMRRSILDFSKGLELTPEEIEDFKTGELLSVSVPTIWAHIVPLAPDGQLLSQNKAAIEQGWRVSSQADELVQFSTNQNLSIAKASKTLDYQLDDEPEVALSARKVLFIHGADARKKSRNLIQGASELRQIKDPMMLQNETLARYRLQQRTKGASLDVRIRGNLGVSITPQGFEVEMTSEKEVMSFAKSIGTKQEEQKFSIKFNDSDFRNLMKQNQFFLVVPTKYADMSGGKSDNELFDLDESIQISDWGFSLDLASSSGTALPLTTDASRDPVLVVKYKKGTLLSLLKNTETWDNYSQESRFPLNKLKSTEATISKWIADIKPPPDRIDSKGKVDYYRVIRSILDDPDWVGTLLIYPQVNLDSIPEGLAGLASGMELDRFRAHHIGFSQNKIELNNGQPSVMPSSFFGLVDYIDARPPENDFSFKVHELKVLFGNSEVKGFDCLLKVKLAKWFGEDTTLENGGAVPKDEPVTGEQTLWIRGRYESLITETGQKINKYSFIHDSPIYLIKRPEEDYENDGKFFQELIISYLEFRTLKSEPQSIGKREISSKLIIDASAKFKKLSLPGISDIINFESIEMNGIAVDFSGLFEKIDGTWQAVNPSSFWPTDLNFDSIAIDASFPKLRRNGLFDNFPLKFKKFHLIKGLSLPDLGYSNFGGDKGDKIKFGLQFSLDLGSLGRLIGFDSSLMADMLVGWNPGAESSFALGLRFPDNGGRRLDMSIGPVKFTAGYFDMFEGDDGNDRFIALTDFRMDINGFKLPPDKFKSGILLTPAPDQDSKGEQKRSYFESMGWLAGFSAEKVAFLDKLSLFVSQNYRYQGPADSAKQVVSAIEDIITLDIGTDESKWKERSREYREKIKSHLTYNTDYEWFIAAGATFADSIVEAYAVYNPPGLYGGEGSLKDLLSLSIMYQQTTPRLGVYTGTLKFAEKIRRFSVGAITIQLPWVVLKMDTDGGYLVIVGLNLADLTDYSNAAAAEFGIFTGSAGVAYGRISGSALKDVPLLRPEMSGAEIALPVYTPVTRITLSGKFGIGRSLDEWPMFRGGVHVSIYGILSGTWGKFNSIELIGRVDRGKIEEVREALPSHYHKYWAEIGILAEIWGVIDFGVTRFGVNARALIGYGVIFETLRGTTAYARALISISIRWVLFSFRVFGKKIEVAIRLKFKEEFRKTYVLARPKSNVSYDDYFITADGVQGLHTLNADELEELIPAEQVIFHLNQSPPVSPKKSIEILPLFDYVRNDVGDVVAVPVLNLPYGKASDTDTGHFEEILGFVIDWSFNALKISDLLSAGRVSKAKVRDCAEAVAALRLRGDRGEWSARRARAHLNTAFSFDYLDPMTLPKEFEEEARGSTVFFSPHDMAAFVINEDDTETQIQDFAVREVPDTFIERLDELFDRRRIQVREDDETVIALQTLNTGEKKLLEDYLIEEYLESILRAAWAILSEKLHAIDMANGMTPEELKHQMLKGASKISMRVNRQFFSGNRVPEGAMDLSGRDFANPAQHTLPLPEARRIEIIIDHEALPKGLILLFDKSRVVFKTDAGAADEIRKLRNIPINFGGVTAKQKSPFIRGAHEGIPLTERMPVLRQGDVLNLYVLPDALRTKIEYKLDVHEKGERRKDTSNTAIFFRQVVLVRVPLLPVEGASDLYQIDRMPEDSRRTLRLMQQAKIDFSNAGIGFSFLRSSGEKKEHFQEVPIELDQSFILRTNLSRDPNPTEIIINTLAMPAIPVRAGFWKRERQTALSILADAAETNSGGYMLRLKDFDDPDTQELTIMIVLPEVRQKSLLPAFVKSIVVDESADVYSSETPLMLREVGDKVVVLGTPGVLELEVQRNNSENLFQSLNIPGLRVSRAQALRERLEKVKALDVVGNLAAFKRFQYTNAAERFLEDAGVEEVNISARYNLLVVSIEENAYYEERLADLDLPVTPLASDNTETYDETAHEQEPDWIYSWSVSAAKLVKSDYAKSRELFPDPEHHFMYGAIGTDMKVKTHFRDIMGYNAPVGEQSAILKVRYYDPLIAPGILSGIKSSHDVLSKELVYTLTFDAAQLNPSQDQKALNLSLAEEMQNLANRAATIMRCMQQLRDKGTHYDLFSTLGFKGGATKRLSVSERKKIYFFLKKCFVAVCDGNSNFTDSLKLKFSLSGKAPYEGYALYRTELVIARDEHDVIESLLLEETKQSLKREVIEKRVEVPLSDEPIGNVRSKEARLAEAVKAFPSLIAAYSQNARGETLVYILDAKMVKLTPIRNDRETAAYAAFEPLATQAESEVGAAFWDWSKNKRPPLQNDSFERLTISNFDMDTAFAGLLHELDLCNAPDRLAHFIKDTETADLIEKLAIARAKIADSLALRHAPIYNSQEDETDILSAEMVLRDNLSNSLKRRISRFYELDTILIVPLAYQRLPIAEDSILLYGSVGQSAGKEANGDNTTQEGNFLPAALRRNGDKGHLCIQFDAANAGASRLVQSPLLFNIEYVRVNLGTGDVGTINSDNTRWLKLFEAHKVTLAPTNKPANIPVLFKSLIKSPIVSIQESPNQDVALGAGLNDLLNWSLIVDVERKDQVAQDDTYLDIDYNTRQEEMVVALNTDPRSILSVLYEYNDLSGKRGGGASAGTSIEDSLWLKAMVYWSETLISLFTAPKTLSTLVSTNFDRVRQHYVLNTKNDPTSDSSDRFSSTLLKKVGNWNSADLTFNLTRINPDKSTFGTSDNRGAGLARVKSIYNPELRYQGNRITIRGLNLMLLENAWPNVWVQRNQGLSDMLPTNKKFIYTSSKVSTGDPYTPSIKVNEAWQISGANLKEALFEFLRDKIFIDLLSKDPNGKSELWPTIDLMWSYESGVLDELKDKHPEVGIFQPEPIARTVAIQTGPKLMSIAELVDSSVNVWLRKNPQAVSRGHIEIRMTIFSRLLKTQKQLLHIEKIQFLL